MDRKRHFGLKGDSPPTEEQIREKLAANVAIVPEPNPRNEPVLKWGSLALLGPGSHKAGAQGAQEYVARLIQFEWNLFLASGSGIPFLQTFKQALNTAYDFVLVDARNGYNYASVILLTH